MLIFAYALLIECNQIMLIASIRDIMVNLDNHEQILWHVRLEDIFNI